MCPICYKHKLLKADGSWYCPKCFHIYGRYPIYGIKINNIKQKF